MTRDDIIRLARKAGLPIEKDDESEYIGCLDFIDREHLVVAIASAERDECAKRLEAVGCHDCAENIRLRGKNV
jgi:hypothetical protein